MSSIDYVENLCVAVDKIIDARIQKLEFDKTIKGVIKDASESSSGKYVVRVGTTDIFAYSLDTYSEGTTVYVTVPNNDYNNKKIIKGKVVSELDDNFNYVSPLEQYTPITQNLVYGQGGLLANGPITYITLYDGLPISGITEKGYNRLAISADFKTELTDAISGNFGLEIVLTNLNDENYTFQFDSSTMNGNPYNLFKLLTQENVYSIENDIGQIKNIKIVMYQSGNFRDINNKPLESKMVDGSWIPYNNIKCENIKLTFGYKTSDLKEDTIYLYANTITYKDRTPIELKLRWAHKIQDGVFKTLLEYGEIENPEDVKIYWYRKNNNNGNKISDKIAGDFWEILTTDRIIYTDTFEAILKPDPQLQNEYIKVIIKVKDQIKYNTIINEYNEKIKEPGVNIGLLQKELSEKLEDCYNIYSSDELILSNEIETVIQAIDQVKALTITHGENDKYNGVYNIYNSQTHILNDNSASRTAHTLEAKWDTLIEGNEIDNGVETITWYIPKHNTMIQAPQINREWFNNETTSYTEIEDYYIITRNFKDDLKQFISQNYYIKDYYTPNANNNDIRCVIYKNGLNYESKISLSFGIYGTNNTAYIVNGTIDKYLVSSGGNPIEDNDSAPLTVSAIPNKADGLSNYNFVLITSNVYTADGKIVDENDITSYSYQWYSYDGENPPIKIASKRNKCYLSWNGEYKHSTKNVLKIGATIKNVTYYNLLPIPSSNGKDYLGAYFSGATRVSYDSSGTNPEYYKQPYKLYGADEKEINNLTFTTTNNNGNEPINANLPYITSQGILRCPNTLTVGEQIITVKVLDNKSNIIWSQPVIIEKSSRSVKANSESDTTLNAAGDKITSASLAIGAQTENGFSGAIAGQLNSDKEGLYGYSDGVKILSLNPDKEMTIGSENTGIITVSNEKTEITSNNFFSGISGIKMNFATGELEAGGNIKLLENKKFIKSLNYVKEEFDETNLSKGTFIDLESGDISGNEWYIKSSESKAKFNEVDIKSLTIDGKSLDAYIASLGYKKD